MPALLSVTGLIFAIAVGYFLHVNIGMLSIAFAFIIGHFAAGLTYSEIVAGWPMNLFFMLLAMTLLFGIAGVNGTLQLIARKVVEATRGRTRLIPPAFFLMSTFLAALGAGNIAIAALVIPIAMTVANEQKIPPLLMASIVITGCNAGGLSPVAPAGIIAGTLSKEIGLDISLNIFISNLIAQFILAIIIYFALRGHRIQNRPGKAKSRSVPFNRKQKTTLSVFLLVVGAILLGNTDIGLTAITGAVILLILKAADEKTALESVPWSAIILISGVGMLVRVTENTGGIEIMTGLLTNFMSSETAAPIMALVGGMVSLISSAQGVAMPTLIPTVPGIVSNIGGEASRLVYAIVIGAHVVTTSPISTLGAVAMATAGKGINREKFFKNLFVIAVLGIIYAAAIVYLGIV